MPVSFKLIFMSKDKLIISYSISETVNLSDKELDGNKAGKLLTRHVHNVSNNSSKVSHCDLTKLSKKDQQRIASILKDFSGWLPSDG